MNPTMIFGILRVLVPPILTYAAGRWPEYAGPIGQILAATTVGGATAWSAATHTQDAQMKAVEAIPEVKKIVVARDASDGLAAAAADTTRPKVAKE